MILKPLGSYFCMLFCCIYIYLKHVFLYFIAVIVVGVKLGCFVKNVYKFEL